MNLIAKNSDKLHYTKNDLKQFSDSNYECKHLYRSLSKGVIIVSKSKSRINHNWRVSYRTSNVFFNTEKEALNFVDERFIDIYDSLYAF